MIPRATVRIRRVLISRPHFVELLSGHVLDNAVKDGKIYIEWLTINSGTASTTDLKPMNLGHGLFELDPENETGG